MRRGPEILQRLTQGGFVGGVRGPWERAVMRISLAVGTTCFLAGCHAPLSESADRIAETSAPVGREDAGHGDTSAIESVVAAAVSETDVTEARVREALVGMGWDASDIETGQNITPTGLDVDNVDAAVRDHESCHMVDVRANRTVTVVTVPTLGSGRCMVGHVHTE
jgi:hypothetical protein